MFLAMIARANLVLTWSDPGMRNAFVGDKAKRLALLNNLHVMFFAPTWIAFWIRFSAAPVPIVRLNSHPMSRSEAQGRRDSLCLGRFYSLLIS
jgi:hypothetical protein